MFIYSIKATTIKFIAAVSIAVISLAVIIFLIPEYTPRTTAAIAETVSKYSYDKIKSSGDRVAFLEQFGWELDPQVIEEVTLKIPAEFDRVMNTYNELQKRGGLDLSKYKGKEVTRYSYEIKNYPDYSGRVVANVIVYKNRVIGGDVSSCDVKGFIGTFEYPSNATDSSEGTQSHDTSELTEGTPDTGTDKPAEGEQ